MAYVPAWNVNCHAPFEPVNVDRLKPQLFTLTAAPARGRPVIELITDPKINRGGFVERTFCGRATSAVSNRRHMHSLGSTRWDIRVWVKFGELDNNHSFEFDSH